MSVTDEIRTLTTPHLPDDWTELDTKAVDTIRVLAADAVQNAGNGHPGTAMSLAPLAYALYQRIMRHDPSDPDWVGRDRFVLSCGHSSLTQYLQLFMSGYGLELDDLRALRKWGSLTPGHPEYGHTAGVEITTGPLGQGLASAVGMAMATRRERGLFDPTAAPGQSVFDHNIYVIASDGDIEEGVTSEASSLAGVQELGNLIVFYDDNKISIEDDTAIALSEDVAKRYEAYGWHVEYVAGGENVTGILDAVERAQQITDKPSMIIVRTIIGYPAPKKMNTGSSHGAALGVDEVAGVKTALGFDPDKHFDVDSAALDHAREVVKRGAQAHAEWQEKFDVWAKENPEAKALFDRLAARKLPEGWEQKLPTWEPDQAGVATRKASGKALAELGPILPELWGGSADLAESNNTTIPGSHSFGPESISTSTWNAQPYGRTLHFGVREHAMGSILNGIALHGPTRPYGGTFLVFSDYMRPAVRLAALMNVPALYVWTHDSIGLGEDGPTHQPIEHLASLRAIPNMSTIRPGDANETSAAWKAALEHLTGPTALALTRQNVPVLEGTKEKAFDGVKRGAYVLAEAGSDLQVVILATGSELHLATEARSALEAEGIGTRVVSVPCLDWFEQQDKAYQDEVLPPQVRARVSVEAGIAMPWHRHLGSYGEAVSIEHFGASADYKTLFREFGITTDAVVAAAKSSITKAAAQ
ncbi:transketolase [Hoyosella rhizosphaerae]|uniref:Transketolase n=1 Tax=Hoyosella rhizosphaerae TaxID=1755582 RepID=A0A916U358_9ACTN|nr:transketolase [Hoyosella rhizosphaerae]MBN4926492.1 transketolase [Hoyosella rhizosphaerae]GGC58910.1 putative transketolase [Hoyosella rhizosphaerae]